MGLPRIAHVPVEHAACWVDACFVRLRAGMFGARRGNSVDFPPPIVACHRVSGAGSFKPQGAGQGVQSFELRFTLPPAERVK